MKTVLIMMAATLVVGGTLSLGALNHAPADRGEILREKAQATMVRQYGQNWFATFRACQVTNRAQAKTMAQMYKSILGTEPVK